MLRLAARITGSRLDVLDAKNRKIFRSWMAAAHVSGAARRLQSGTDGSGGHGVPAVGSASVRGLPRRGLLHSPAGGLSGPAAGALPQAEKRTEHLTVFLLRRGAAAALRQRPDTGLLAGLWEYPHVPGALTEAEAARQLQMWG